MIHAEEARPLREAAPFADFVIREKMVPMRDGVKLYTVIVNPRDATDLPILLERTSRIVSTPNYGPYWRAVAADRWFEAPPRLVPALHVHGYWDQEDIFGAPAAYAALERHDKNNDVNFFAAGPWYHGQHEADGSRLGDVAFDEDTAKRFREQVLVPFLRRFLHGEHDLSISPVTAYESGTNRWRQFEEWPPAGRQSRLYLHPEGKLAFTPPEVAVAATEYISDPAKPVPYAPRPVWSSDYDNPIALAEWRRWLVEDQRFVDGRPDVATWISEPLEKSMTFQCPGTS